MLGNLFGRGLGRLGLTALLATLPLAVSVSLRRTLIRFYARLSGMGKTIRVSEEFHSWLEARKRDDESMEDALRRLTRGPHPSRTTGVLTPEQAEEAKEAVDELRESDSERKRRAREAFADDE
ncbi:antitoxin VapB family protein [Halorussus sp. AFM4]|uniref:antitoxin VapB family protein n=1 Tax=Halorussus sp. AFM4 TaxID=3421651 RepID=UPI003EB8420F